MYFAIIQPSLWHYILSKTADGNWSECINRSISKRGSFCCRRLAPQQLIAMRKAPKPFYDRQMPPASGSTTTLSQSA